MHINYINYRTKSAWVFWNGGGSSALFKAAISEISQSSLQLSLTGIPIISIISVK